MGWASGSSLLDDVAKLVMPLIPKEKRSKVARKLVDIFQSEDCDTINECDQKDIRAEYERRYPPDDRANPLAVVTIRLAQGETLDFQSFRLSRRRRRRSSADMAAAFEREKMDANDGPWD